jgi:heme oxygenase (biliverdin-producing, ferredoxin)
MTTSAAVATVSTADPLSLLLRTATADQHARAERSDFIDGLMSGRGSVDAYRALLVQLREVYAALETSADLLAADPIAARFRFPELRRLPSIEHDLAELGETQQISVLPATRAYVERLATVGRTAPGHLAHAYTRYLGDLSGGQVIGRTVHRHYGIPAAALTFYDFPGIPKPKLFKDEFRARLDAAPLDGPARARVIAEAGTAFDLNAAVFADLAEMWAGAG